VTTSPTFCVWMLALAAAALGELVVGSASAQEADAEPGYPRLSVTVPIEIESDNTVDATDSAAELSDTYTTTEAEIALEYAEGSGAFALLVLEPLIDPEDDRFFEDIGLYAEELYLRHDFGPLAVIGGKFDPDFGVAWDAAPGIYGVDFAEDYELTERIGFGVEVPFALAGGEHLFSASTYFADTTALSDSALFRRGQTDRSDGGVSNTESFESFAVAVSGEIDALGYNVGLRYQERGRGDADDELGGVLGLTYAVALGEGELGLLGEVALFDGYQGATDDATYGTFGASYGLGPWSGSAVYAFRDVDNATTDHLATATLDYTFDAGVTASVAYRYGDEGGVESHTIGFLLAYELGFVTDFSR